MSLPARAPCPAHITGLHTLPDLGPTYPNLGMVLVESAVVRLSQDVIKDMYFYVGEPGRSLSGVPHLPFHANVVPQRRAR